MPLINRLRLQEFLCFGDLDVVLGDFNVIVGPNDSGKTALLNALYLVGRIAAARDTASRQIEDDAHAALIDRSGLRRVGAPQSRPTTVAIEGMVGNTAYGVLLHYVVGADDRLRATLGRVRLPGGDLERTNDDRQPYKAPAGISVLESHRSVLAVRPRATDNTDMAGVDFLRQYEALHGSLRRIAAYQLRPEALRKVTPAPKSRSIPDLGFDGEGLPSLLSVLASAEPAAYRRIQDAFAVAVPALAGFGVYPTELRPSEPAHELRFKVKGNREELAAGDVSDGVMLFLGYLALMAHPTPPTLLLIEEPENGVHPARLKDIVRALRTVGDALPEVSRPQIVMTTHSPYLLDEMKPEEVHFAVRDDDGAPVLTRFDRVRDLPGLLAGYRLGEVWTAYGEKRLLALSRGGDAS